MLRRLLLKAWNSGEAGGGEVAAEVAAEEAFGVFGDDFVGVEMLVVEECHKLDAAGLDGLKREDGVVDRP